MIKTTKNKINNFIKGVSRETEEESPIDNMKVVSVVGRSRKRVNNERSNFYKILKVNG